MDNIYYLWVFYDCCQKNDSANDVVPSRKIYRSYISYIMLRLSSLKQGSRCADGVNELFIEIWNSEFGIMIFKINQWLLMKLEIWHKKFAAQPVLMWTGDMISAPDS